MPWLYGAASLFIDWRLFAIPNPGIAEGPFPEKICLPRCHGDSAGFPIAAVQEDQAAFAVIPAQIHGSLGSGPLIILAAIWTVDIIIVEPFECPFLFVCKGQILFIVIQVFITEKNADVMS